MLSISHNMQHVVDVLHGKIHIRIDVGCQWEHGYLKSMFGFQNVYMAFQIDV